VTLDFGVGDQTRTEERALCIGDATPNRFGTGAPSQKALCIDEADEMTLRIASHRRRGRPERDFTAATSFPVHPSITSPALPSAPTCSSIQLTSIAPPDRLLSASSLPLWYTPPRASATPVTTILHPRSPARSQSPPLRVLSVYDSVPANRQRD
jgi:hypothetical protein